MTGKDFCFISYDTEDPLAQAWAQWIAGQLPAGFPLEVVVPHQSWALGDWTCYLRDRIVAARHIVAVLTSGFLSTSHPFVQEMRRLVLQESTVSLHEQGAQPRLLVALAEDCSGWLHEGSMLYRAPFVDLRQLREAELTCRRSLLEQVQGWGFSLPGSGASAGASPLLSAGSPGPRTLSAWIAQSGAH